jgi:ribosomal protection tetracycline resistance protein
MPRSHPPEKPRSSDPSDAHRPDGAAPAPRRWLNLGVLAHVDAGKTSLTEALLHAGGALGQLGRVDDGTTQTDTMALERRRGITIRTAVATFAVDDVAVNLVDTPGHPDFIAEVDRSLAVLDGAVLVLSAVEGVQAQTIVLHRALRRLRVPSVFMINKIDRDGADVERVLAAIRRRLTPAAIPLGRAHDQGTPAASYRPSDRHHPAVAEQLTAALAEHDDRVLRTWVDQGRALDAGQLDRHLERLTRDARVHPVVYGSAVTGAGVADLIGTITSLLAAPVSDANGPLDAAVFKIDRSSQDRVCFVRIRSGSLTVRDHVPLGPEREGIVTGLEVQEPGGPVGRSRVTAGQVARVHGLSAARIGDRIGSTAPTTGSAAFPRPALETAVVARDPGQQVALHAALAELADIDPLIGLRPDDHHGAVRISVYGEVQQQVIADTLAAEYGIAADFRAATVICVERPARAGRAVLRMGEGDHLHHYTLGVTVEPAAPGAGVQLIIAAPRSTLPLHVYSTVEDFADTVRGHLDEPLKAGPHGWQVTDLTVTVVESGYIPPGPPPAHVRMTTARVVAEAIQRAGTVVCEPVDRFRIEAPPDVVSSVLGLLGRHRAIPEAPEAGASVVVITGTMPTAEVDAVRLRLPGVTRGEGLLESAFDHHAPTSGRPRRRPS